MQPKAKFWVDFFNYLFRVVTFKKIIPQPRKTKRKNYNVALKPLTITTIMSNVWRGRAWGIYFSKTYSIKSFSIISVSFDCFCISLPL